jgi:hypothetical protein
LAGAWTTAGAAASGAGVDVDTTTGAGEVGCAIVGVEADWA